eukprot:s11_g16.t1
MAVQLIFRALGVFCLALALAFLADALDVAFVFADALDLAFAFADAPDFALAFADVVDLALADFAVALRLAFCFALGSAVGLSLRALAVADGWGSVRPTRGRSSNTSVKWA